MCLCVDAGLRVEGWPRWMQRGCACIPDDDVRGALGDISDSGGVPTVPMVPRTIAVADGRSVFFAPGPMLQLHQSTSPSCV